MAFSPSGRQWVIEFGQHRAVVVEVGGGVRAYQVAGRHILDGYAESEPAPYGAGQVLAPWPNRIGDGTYSFGGQAHALPLSEPERGNAMHGLVRWLSWQPDEVTPDAVRLSCRLAAQPGYPWSLHMTTAWSVGPDGLRAAHTATNLADRPCPFGLGVHPYLHPPAASVADTLLTVPARIRLLVDARLLPIGSAPVTGTDDDFTTARPIGQSELDTAFGDLVPGDNAVRLSNPDGTGAVRVWADAAFRWWQIFTGDTLAAPRHRRSIAVEPMTCPPDAFRSGHDLAVLEPGQTWQGAWGITPAASP